MAQEGWKLPLKGRLDSEIQSVLMNRKVALKVEKNNHFNNTK